MYRFPFSLGLKGPRMSRCTLSMGKPHMEGLSFWFCRPYLEISNDVLYYRWIDKSDRDICLVVPVGLKDEVLRCCHDCKTSENLGQRKTIENIKPKGTSGRAMQPQFCIIRWMICLHPFNKRKQIWVIKLQGTNLYGSKLLYPIADNSVLYHWHRKCQLHMQYEHLGFLPLTIVPIMIPTLSRGPWPRCRIGIRMIEWSVSIHSIRGNKSGSSSCRERISMVVNCCTQLLTTVSSST
jgi:hypothetical protein